MLICTQTLDTHFESPASLHSLWSCLSASLVLLLCTFGFATLHLWSYLSPSLIILLLCINCFASLNLCQTLSDSSFDNPRYLVSRKQNLTLSLCPSLTTVCLNSCSTYFPFHWPHNYLLAWLFTFWVSLLVFLVVWRMYPNIFCSKFFSVTVDASVPEST